MQAVVHKSFLYESGRALRDILMGSVVVDQRRIACPVLVGVGAKDRATPPGVAKRIARKYGAECRQYEGQCHFLGASNEVIEDVTSWVEQHTRS
jgi:pimeloyl-ACP methyl ester carboxylesterase